MQLQEKISKNQGAWIHAWTPSISQVASSHYLTPHCYLHILGQSLLPSTKIQLIRPCQKESHCVHTLQDACLRRTPTNVEGAKTNIPSKTNILKSSTTWGSPSCFEYSTKEMLNLFNFCIQNPKEVILWCIGMSFQLLTINTSKNNTMKI